MDSLKRFGVKRRAPNFSPPKKKAKLNHVNLDDLQWKSVKFPNTTGLGGDDGILGLEEVDGVEVLYEETGAGRTVKFNVNHSFLISLLLCTRFS